MQIINKHSLTVLEVTSRERGEEFKGVEWVELQSYVSALRAERDELRSFAKRFSQNFEACDVCEGSGIMGGDACRSCRGTTIQIASYGVMIADLEPAARDILAKYEVTK